MKNRRFLFIFIILLIFSACSSTTKNNKDISKNETIEKLQDKPTDLENYFGVAEDPWEPFNRRMYHLNYNIDKYAFMPIVRTYKYITPIFVQDRVTNFFRNLKGINTTANSLAQFKGRKAMRAIARFTVNTIFGLGGTFDVASKMGMPKPYEDFGLTLAHYGVKRGPYIILPLFGPSFLRDTFGMGAEAAITRKSDPYGRMELFETYDLPVTVLNGIDRKSNVKFEFYGTSSPFEYEYMRFLWSRYRKLQEETGVQLF